MKKTEACARINVVEPREWLIPGVVKEGWDDRARIGIKSDRLYRC